MYWSFVLDRIAADRPRDAHCVLICGCVVVVCPPGRKGKSEEQSQWLLPRSQRLSSVGAKRSVGCQIGPRDVWCGGRIIRRLLQLESESETNDNRFGIDQPGLSDYTDPLRCSLPMPILRLNQIEFNLHQRLDPMIGDESNRDQA